MDVAQLFKNIELHEKESTETTGEAKTQEYRHSNATKARIVILLSRGTISPRQRGTVATKISRAKMLTDEEQTQYSAKREADYSLSTIALRVNKSCKVVTKYLMNP